MEEKYNFHSGQHRLVIENREHTEITGVLHVDSLSLIHIYRGRSLRGAAPVDLS